MKRQKIRNMALSICTAVLSFSISSCQFGSSEEETESHSVTDLRITNEISGWSEGGQMPYYYFNIDQMYEKFDGKADDFKDILIDGIYQELHGTDSRYIRVWITDVATSENAKSIWDVYVQKNVTVPLELAGYDNQTVLAQESQTGMNTMSVYAHFDKFFFEIAMAGYQDKPSLSNDAIGFLGTYKSKL